MSIYKDCDVRGIYQKELREDDLYAMGRALATMLPGGSFCVGGDVRLSTPTLKAALIRGLLAGGSRVTDLGTIPTPCLYFALSQGAYDGGATVTASHNPREYNGLKFMLGAAPVTRETVQRLESVVRAGAFRDGDGALRARDVEKDYLARMKARFGQGLRGLRVVVDAGNGAASLLAPRALAQAGAEVFPLFCEMDGSFPNRTPNPAEYGRLGALSEAVLAHGADYGVAFDGDGDRAVFCDEKGRIVISERALALFIRRLLRDRPAPVVYDQKSSSVVRSAILACGGTPVPERSGHMFIKKRFLDLHAPIAGEVSGHFFFGELGYDDGLFAALMMGEVLSESDAPLSALLADIQPPPITPDIRFHVPYGEMDRILAGVCDAARADEEVSRMDGIRLEGPEGWLLLRRSVTAEQMTLRIEGHSDDALRKIAARVASLLPPEGREALKQAGFSV